MKNVSWFKKINIALISTLILIFVIMVFAGCGNSRDNENKKDNTNSPTEDVRVSGTPLPTKKPTPVPSPTPYIPRDQNDEVPEKRDYTIPKAKNSPVIDAKADEGEWEGALIISLNNKNTWDPSYGKLSCQGGTFKYLWDEKGLYLYAEINDKEGSSYVPEAGSGSYNIGDGVQICIYADPEITAATNGKMFFFSLCPAAQDGKPYLGEHFTYGNGSDGKDVPESEIAAAKTEKGYVVEARIDSRTLAKSTPAVKLEEGKTFPMLNVILDCDAMGNQSIFADSGWFSGPSTNVYVLGE